MGVPGGGQTEGLAQAAQAEWMRAARYIGWYGRARQRASDLSVAGGPGRCAAAAEQPGSTTPSTWKGRVKRRLALLRRREQPSA